jgi:hypothetical protein
MEEPDKSCEKKVNEEKNVVKPGSLLVGAVESRSTTSVHADTNENLVAPASTAVKSSPQPERSREAATNIGDDLAKDSNTQSALTGRLKRSRDDRHHQSQLHRNSDGESSSSFGNNEDAAARNVTKKRSKNTVVASADSPVILSGPTSDMNANVESEQSEQMRLEERRAYNRRNAARSRLRVKDQLRDLQQQVMKQTATSSKLERSNVRLVAENSVLRDEVNKLRSLLSGAPLFGQQPQSLQPFVPQFPISVNPAVSHTSQTSPHHQTALQISNPTAPSIQQMPQFMFNNPMAQQQLPGSTSSLVSSTSHQQQVSGHNNDIHQQNQLMQLLLQHIMNSNGTNTSPVIYPTSTQEQQHFAAAQQHQAQQEEQQASLASFMAFLGGGGNPAESSVAQGTTTGISFQQQAMALPGSSVLTETPSISSVFHQHHPSVHQQPQLVQQEIQQLTHQIQQQNQQELQQNDRRGKNSSPSSQEDDSINT